MLQKRFLQLSIALALGVVGAEPHDSFHPLSRKLGGSSKDKNKKGGGSGDSSDDAAGADDNSFTFPPTTTSEFVHGLCVMGASSVHATCTDPGVSYNPYPEPFGNGVKIWGDRNYMTKGIEGPEMCEGGTFLAPSNHKKIKKGAEIQISATPKDGQEVTVCAFTETGRRDGDWDKELPKLGFMESESFVWDDGKISGTMRSYCKTLGASDKSAGKGSGKKVCARGTGDPHFTTYDGVKYDCQGQGDYILSKSLDSDFELQGRFEIVPGRKVTTHQGAVIKTGFEGEPVVEVAFNKQCEVSYYLDDTAMDLETTPETGTDMVEFIQSGSDRYFEFKSGVTLHVNLRKSRAPFGCLLNVFLCIPEALASERIVGIYGTPDGNGGNDFTSRDGTPVTRSLSNREKHEHCVSTWCIPSPADNLFVVPGSTDASCAVPFDEELERQLENVDLEIVEQCGGNEACIVDAVVGGDVEFGLETLIDEEKKPDVPPEEEILPAFAPPKEPAPEPAPAPAPGIQARSFQQQEKTPAKGSGSGDPHFKTWTGEKYDYHGECDLVLVDNPTFNNGQGLRVHIRTTRVKYFSFIEKVAVQIGDEVLEFDNDVENFYINGQRVGENKLGHKTHLSGFVVRRDKKALSIRLQDGGTREAREAGAVAKIDLHMRKNGFPAVIVDAGKTDIFAGSLGLLGEFGTGHTLARDGKTVIEVDPESADAFALEWQVRDTDPSLFLESRFPQFPQVCIPPEKMIKARLGMSKAMEEAREACAHWKHDMDDCIFDVIATRDVTTALEGHVVHIE